MDRAVGPSRTPRLTLGLGPVFEFEWLTGSRRWQGYALRSGFVLFLLAALVVNAWARWNDRIPTTFGELAQIGQRFYVAVIGTELTLVLLAAPAATAGAICLDKARGTLTHLLVTDLNASEIVLGKLAARLVPVLGLIGCSLPVLALLTLLGGVDPDAVIGGCAVSVGVALLGCSLAMLISLWAGKTHEALLATYAVWALWLLSGYMINPINMALGLSINPLPASINPFYLVLAPYWHPGQVGWLDYGLFLGVCAVISAALTLLAIVKLRTVCTRVNVRKTTRSWRFFAPNGVLGSRLARLSEAVGPTLDFNPVLWREWHRNRPSGWSRAVAALFVCLATTFSLIAVIYESTVMMAVVNAFEVSIGLLLISVSASTSLAEERVRGSLDVLLTTPMSTSKIVLGKWLGTFRRVVPLTVLPALVILFGGGRGPSLRVVGALVMIGYIVAAGAAVTSLGLAAATWCSRLGRAVGLTVSTYVVMSVGWMFLVMALCTPNPYGWSLITGSPFYGAILVTVRCCEPRFTPDAGLGYAVLWIFLDSGIALLLLLTTLATFNRCLGRVEGVIIPANLGAYKPVELIPMEKSLDPEFAPR